MSQTPDSTVAPAPDLDLCAREPIHLSGAIQPHGCLIACRLADWTINWVSDNVAATLGLEAGRPLLGQPIDSVLDSRVVHDLRNTLQGSMISGTAERLTGVRPVGEGASFDIATHASGTNAILEFMPHGGSDTTTTDPIILVKSMVGRMKRAPTLARFLQIGAAQMRAVTGYDHVMIYRFLPDDSGQVVAEALRPGLQPLIGLRYPASDIPAQARALYRRQWLRTIVDVNYRPVPLRGLPGANPQDLDLSLSTLRSISPVHLEYLRNMGSGATLTISIMAGDKLWGLIACHHEVPRRIAATTAAAAELFGQIFSLQIEARERDEERGHAVEARDALDRLLSSMPVEETPFDNLPRFESDLRALIPSDGVAVWSDGRFSGVGTLPPAGAMPSLIAFLDARDEHEPFISSVLGRDWPLAATFADRVSGMIAIPFARASRDYLMFFRQEELQTVTWGGNPNKPVEVRDGGKRLSPRKSFEAWRETVRGQSIAWRPSEMQIARSLRISLLDVILRRADVLNQERKAAQESQSLLIAELNHRVKNVLALIRSLVRQSRRGAQTVEDFTADLEHRIRALAFAHDQLTQVGWRGAPLHRLLRAEVEAWAGSAGDRVELSGPSVILASRAYQSLALVLHEMMTNAAKYGSLSVDTGRLAVTWSIDDAGDLDIRWTETGGPVVRTPERRGFGSTIVEQTIPFELQGESAVSYLSDGVRAIFRIPAQHLVPQSLQPHEQPEDLAPQPVEPLDDLSDKRLLLVEDSMMIALDAQGMLAEAGCNVEIAGTVADATRALQVNVFDMAVLDINLSGETSFAVAERLAEVGVPFVLATGYGESVMIPDRFSSTPVVAKPYDASALRRALARVS